MFKFKAILVRWLVFSALFFGMTSSATASPTTVTYCINPSWVPYEMLRNGAHVGISAEYLEVIGELADIKFELVVTDSWQQSLEFVQTGKCMVLPMLAQSYAHRTFLSFTSPYFATPNVLVSDSYDVMYHGVDGLTHQLVAVDKNSYLAEYLARYYPDIRLQLMNSETEAVRELVRGNVDVMAGAMLSVNSELNRMNLQDMAITGYLEPMHLLRMGVNRAHAELVPVLNSAIERIPEATSVAIYKRWNNVKSQRQQDFRLGIMVVFCGGIVLATLIWRKNLLRRCSREMRHKQDEMENLQTVLLEKNRMLEFLSSHDTATNLYNRNFMLHRAEDEVSRFNRFHTAASLILFDFTSHSVRQMNSRPLINEEGIKELARICLSCVREVDIAGRWSSEQIIVLCPQTPISASKVLAERLKEAVETHQRPDIRELPFSIGLAALQEGETFADWYERASQALYLARRQHGGKVMIAET